MKTKLYWFEEIECEDRGTTAIEIVVSYDTNTFEVEDIEAVYLRANMSIHDRVGECVSVWPLFKQIPELDVSIEKIVARVDWRELYLHPNP